MRNASPSEMLKVFKLILKEAGETFGKAPCDVTKTQFLLIANGRFGEHRLAKFGSYTSLRQWAAPNKGEKGQKSEMLKVLERLAKNAA